MFNPYKLTRKEYEIMRCIAKGMNEQEICSIMFNAHSTIKCHTYRIRQRLLLIKTRRNGPLEWKIQAVRMLLKAGTLTVEDILDDEYKPHDQLHELHFIR